MAERKDAIALYAEKEGIPYSEALKNLTELNKDFEQLYVRGRFDLTKANDRQAHNSMAAAFVANEELFEAFDSWRRAKYGESMPETILEASNTLGAFNPINSLYDAVTGQDKTGDLKKAAMGPYNFIEKLDGTYDVPWRSEQIQDESMEAFNEATPISDARKKELETEAAQKKALELSEEQKAAQAQNIFNVDQDPQIAAVRQQVDRSKANPFMFGTEGNRSQIDSLLDASSDKIPMPNRSDARSVADFNNAFANRQFVKNAAFRKQRELDDLAEDRQAIVNNHLGAMSAWEAKNKGKHVMADKGVENWTDQDKIAFVRNFNLGNFDEPAPAKAQEVDPRGVPMFDKDGRMGFVPHAEHTPDKPGQKFKVNMDQPNMLQRQERRKNAMLEDIRNEENPLKPGQKYHPFEMFGGSTDHAAEVAKMESVDLPSPASKRKPVDLSNPAPQRDDRYKNPAYSQQTPISQVDQVRKDVNTEVNDVLSQVSIPGASQNSDILDRAPINATPVPSRRRVRNQKPAPLDIPARTWPDYTGY